MARRLLMDSGKVKPMVIPRDWLMLMEIEMEIRTEKPMGSH